MLEIEQLAQRLSIYRDAYSTGNPLISDAVYDNLEDKLRKLSPNHPFLSGTAGEVVSSFPKATSGEPMLSLDKVTDVETLKKFVIGDKKIVIRAKLDGGSLELRYREGVLTEAVSRGRSGSLGFVCTNNAMQLLNVPHFIEGFNGEIRGEAIQTWEHFNDYSKKEIAKGESAPKHPRNVVTGTMRQENPKIVKERNISFVAYKIMGHYEELPTEEDVNKFLVGCGFTTPTMLTYNSETFKDYSDKILNGLAGWKLQIDKAPYYCDGIVVSYNDRNLQRELGNSTTAPRWSKAFKWQNEIGESDVISIDWETGRTGHVVPIGNISPVELGGATIARVTFHNLGYVTKHKINVGATIAISRAGEIIPKHLETLETTGILDIPTKCPSCKSVLVIETNEKDEEKSSLNCVSPNCPEQAFQRILYFIETVNIEHCGPAILKALWDANLVRKTSDLYNLKSSDIASVTSSGKNVGDSTGKKIIESINANKEMELTTFIAALGIPNMSSGTAERLVEKFGNIDAIISANKEDFVGIRDFGEITCNVVFNGLKANKELIAQLVKHITFKVKEKVIGGALDGLKFVITGTLSSPRDDFEAKIQSAGGTLQSAVSKNTSYLIAGEAPGESKVTKANKLGVKTITENDLLKMMNK